jgi:hypothetical protein
MCGRFTQSNKELLGIETVALDECYDGRTKGARLYVSSVP